MGVVSAPVPGLEPAFDVVVHLGALEDHGVTRAGHRRVVPIVGGSVTGAFEAEILPGGADWQIVRADGSVEVDAQYSARTPAGALVLLHATGVRTGPPDVLAALLRAATRSQQRTTASARSCASRPRSPRSRRCRTPCSSRRPCAKQIGSPTRHTA